MSCPHCLNAAYEVKANSVRVEVTYVKYYLCSVGGNLVVLLSVFSKNGSEVVGECVAVELFEDVKLCM